MGQPRGTLAEFTAALKQENQEAPVSEIRDSTLSRITLPPGISVPGADPQQWIRSSSKGNVFARDVLRGIGCLVVFALTAAGSWGQQSPGANPGGPTWVNRQLDDLADEMNQKDSIPERAMRPASMVCVFEPYSGLSNTVSVRSLEVPEKAQNEYDLACNALRSKKTTESEKHLRKALQYSQDAFGWVMLGRVLEITEQWDEASKACTEALVHDPYYWAADVCLAEVDGHQLKWKASLEASNRAVLLNPASKRFAYYISAVALFNLNQISEAESRALEAEKLDGDHRIPALRLALARIEEVKGDLRAADTQLRDCLNYAQNSPEGEMAEQELVQLGVEPN